MVKDFLKDLDKGSQSKKVLAGVVFTQVPSDRSRMSVSEVEYKLRFPSTLRSAGRKQNLSPFSNHDHWMTQFMFPVFQQVGPRGGNVTQGGSPGAIMFSLRCNSHISR